MFGSNLVNVQSAADDAGGGCGLGAAGTENY